MFARIELNRKEVRVLAALRDALLPKLISGELRVVDAEEFIGNGGAVTASLPPWANGPLELLVHAEGHLRGGEDFDRRIALISFDNAIEVTIATYLKLNPIQRDGRPYKNSDVETWLSNYYTKLDFLEAEIVERDSSWQVEKGHIIWAHDHRNEQYHGGHKGTPERSRPQDRSRCCALGLRDAVRRQRPRGHARAGNSRQSSSCCAFPLTGSSMSR